MSRWIELFEQAEREPFDAIVFNGTVPERGHWWVQNHPSGWSRSMDFGAFETTGKVVPTMFAHVMLRKVSDDRYEFTLSDEHMEALRREQAASDAEWDARVEARRLARENGNDEPDDE